MTLLHMKYAVEIAETNSINKAAERLYVGQSALSRAIKELETSLGTTLFERSAKGMVLTQDGEVFIRYAKRVLEQVDELENTFGGGALLHHSVQKMDIAGFKDDDREISGFGKQRVSAMPQAVFGALEDKGSIAQLGEAYGVFPGERMRTRKHSKHFFPGKGKVCDLCGKLTVAQRQIDLGSPNGFGLFLGVELSQFQSCIRITAGKGLIDPAVDDSAAVGRGSEADFFLYPAGERPNGEKHPVLLIQDISGGRKCFLTQRRQGKSGGSYKQRPAHKGFQTCEKFAKSGWGQS